MNASCCWCRSGLVCVEGIWWCPTVACQTRQREHAVGAKTKKGQQWLYVPTPKQATFDACPAKYVLYGGAAGPGKSHAARWALYRRALSTPGFEGLLLRKTFPELEKTHLRRMEREAPLLGAEFIASKRLMTFPVNGSLIECGHMDDAAAVSKYLSSEYDLIVPDEGSTFDPDGLLELSTRSVDRRPGGKFWVVSNPGGPASGILLDFFVDHRPDFEARPQLQAKYHPDDWVYIPGTLDDNPYIDPGYEASLAVLPKWRYEQLRYGDWRVAAGQFFEQWQEQVEGRGWHVRTLRIDAGVEHFVSLDWGYRAPGCALWWACLPDGEYHIRHEWKFKGLEADEAARAIKKQTTALGVKRLRYVVADPSMWNKGGDSQTVRGESKAETMIRLGLPVRKGDNDRVNGWSRCSLLLRPPLDGTRPRFSVDPSCAYLRRTIPAALADKTNPEDVDTTIDDHGLDAWRYGAMSRPSPTRVTTPKRPKGSAGKLLEDLVTELRVD